MLKNYCLTLSKILIFSSLLIALTACGNQSSQTVTPGINPSLETSSPTADQATPVVYVTNYPLQYFAERIVGNTIKINYLVPPNIDPAFWQPTSQDIAQMQAGDLIFVNGATYEKWLNTVSLSEAKLVNTSVSFQDRYIAAPSGSVHRHGPEGEHQHTGTAFTTWLDFKQAIAQADAIRGALTKLRPDLAETFQGNFETLKQDLEAFDQQLLDITANKHQIPLLASHPVYQYFARAYGLNLKSLHWEPDDVPTEVQWQELQKLLQSHPAQWIIWEDTPNPETVAQLKQLNINSLVFNPLGNQSDPEDFISLMNQNLSSLKPID
ncbi:MAG: metal ABC transporter substrate-binding protein [Synechocystis sp.]|nr:metal ABC transporter substrate-binding protein [Synechocystis sp.]